MLCENITIKDMLNILKISYLKLVQVPVEW